MFESGIGTSPIFHESLMGSHSWENMNIEQSKSAICSMKDAAIRDQDIVTVPDVNGGKSLDSKDCHGQLSVPNAGSDQDMAPISSEINICLEFNQSLSLDIKAHKNLSKCNSFPVSKETEGHSLPDNGGAGCGLDSFARGSSTYSRSISLPPSSTLVPAMKGGRVLSGAIVKAELRVKWAPEVCDPPATSMSHTVKSHQQRSKAKKKDKHKHKGKSSKGNNNERKHANRKSLNKTPQPLNVRLQGNGDGFILDGFDKAKMVDILEYGVNGQEEKCGSSFLREVLPKVHLPIGEAS